VKNVRIVVADPDATFREACAALLRGQGYEVTEAASLDETRWLLDARWFHLAIVSVQMESPDDPNDHSGLDLVRERRPLLQILVSGFPSYELMREVMHVGRQDTPRLVDFLEKKEVMQSAEIIAHMIDELIPINWELHIRLLNGVSFLSMAQQMYGGTDYAALIEYAYELEDLFRKLFNHSHQITLNKVLVQRNLSLVAETFVYGTKAEERVAVLVDFPARNQGLKQQLTRGEKTIHFQALAVPLNKDEKMMLFREWYRSQPPEGIARPLNRLLQAAFTPEAEPQAQDGELVVPFYGEPPYTALDARIKSLCQEATAAGVGQIHHQGRKLSLRLGEGAAVDFPNPVYAIQERAASAGLSNPLHDRLSSDSIFVWNEGSMRLLPVLSGSEDSAVHNLAAFELSLHLDMPANLAGRLEAENALLTGVSGHTAEAVPPQVATVIGLVRQFAAGFGPSYDVALFLSALEYVAGYDPDVQHMTDELVNYVHALLIAAMLCQSQSRFVQLPDNAPEEARQTLWIDLSARMVWVEGVHVPVTPQEFEILKYLYANVGKTCSREAILKEGLGDDVDDLFVEQSRLDSAMSRLRLKLELNPKQPRYLHTVRGYGYQLTLT
jgi:DNA-binding response OmpR family regulator